MIKNMLTSGLLFAIILILFACDDPVKLGLDLQRDDQRISTFFTDTFAIETTLKLFDTLNTTVNDAQGRGVVGTLNNSLVGKITSKALGGFVLPSTGISFTDATNTTAIFDSLVLNLLVTYSQGDTSKAVTINVHRLTQALTATKSNYHNTTNFPNGELLGSVQRKVKAGNIITIKLKDSFGQEIMDNNNTDQLKIQSNFEQFIRGISISMEGAENLVFGFDPTDRNSITRLAVYFRNNTVETSAKVRNLFFTGGNGAGILFNNIQYDFTQIPALRNLATSNTKTISSSRTNNLCYSISSVGIFPLIKFPSIYGFSKNRDVVVNRAELIIEPSPLNFSIPRENFTIPNLRFIVANAKQELDVYDNTIIPKYILQETATSISAQNVLSMPYISGGRSYQSVIVTSYIQALMNQTTENRGLFIVPEQFQSSLDYVVFGDNRATSNRMRLLVYYTTIKR
jgi:hypothetical protein